MKLIILTTFIFCEAFLASPASASVASYGPSSQTITFTGIANNSLGEGQSHISWGNCTVSGSGSAAVTSCTVSAPFTGIGPGGTVNLVFSYAGTGALPLNAVSTTPGGNLVTFNATANVNFVATFMENNGTTFSLYNDLNWVFNFNNPSCSSNILVCSVAQVGATPNATITGTISGTFDATPAIRTSLGVISASSFGAFTAVAPGTWMEIYGTNLATVASPQGWGSANFNGNLAPTSLAGTTVTIGGQPAYIDYVSATQVNAQAPSNVPTGMQPVVVTTAGGSSTAFMIQVNATEPGMLAPPQFQLGSAQYIVALFPDGVTYVLPPGVTNAVPTAVAKPGNTIIFYGVGFGPVTPNIPAGQIVPYTPTNGLTSNFQVSFGGVPATVNFAGLAGGYVGLYQFNVVVPNVPANSATPLTFSLGGTQGPQNMVIAVGN